MSAMFLYPFILFAGALQSVGNVMNAQLKNSVINPWFASVISFGLIVAVFFLIWAVFPRPMPTAEGLATMPWWAPLGGIVGAIAVFAGLIFVDKIGAGPFAGLLITANLIMSLIIDNWGLINMPVHSLNIARGIGALMLIIGTALIAAF